MYSTEVLADTPYGLWTLSGNLDSATGLNHATAVGTLSTYAPPLISGHSKSLRISSTAGVSFPAPRFRTGLETLDFTLEAWVFPIDDTFYVLSHGGEDGLLFEDGAVVFRLNTTAGVKEVAYYPDSQQSMHIVGTYAAGAMALYVNGLLHESMQLEDMGAFQITTDDGLLYAGGGDAVIGGVAFYTKSLTPSDVEEHFVSGRQSSADDTLPSVFRGVPLVIDEAHADVFLTETVGMEVQWTEGFLDGTTVDDRGLVQQLVDGDLPEAKWLFAFDLGFARGPVEYVTLGWDGEGQFTVETSIDNETWALVGNNDRSTSIARGMDGTGKQLFIRVTFPANDNGHITWMNITGFKSDDLAPGSRYPVTTTGDVVVRDVSDSMEYRCDTGTYLKNGSLIVSPPAEINADSPGIGAVSFWYYNDGTFTIPTGNASVYTNGAVGTFTSKTGQWEFVVLNRTAADAAVEIAGTNAIVSTLAVYPANLTMSEVADLYAMYTGVIRHSITVSGTPPAFGGSAVVTILASDWELTQQD